MAPLIISLHPKMTFIVKIGHFCYWTPRLNVGLCQHPLTNTNILSYQQFSNIIDMKISLSWRGYCGIGLLEKVIYLTASSLFQAAFMNVKVVLRLM